jgi:hypothetical protein
MRLNNLARLNQEFGQFQLPNKTGHEPTMKLANAYLELEHELNNLKLQKRIYAASLEFARDDINNLESQNIVLTLKLNASQAINFTLGFCLLLSFLGFGTVVLALTNLVSP